MNDANLKACSWRTGVGNGFLPSSCRAIIHGASTLASTIRSAGYSFSSTVTSTDENYQCEQIQWAGFDKLELVPDNVRQVLLLSYASGFQVWDVENADDVKEIVSKRDVPNIFLCLQPQPAEKCDEKLSHPLLLIVTFDASKFHRNGCFTNGYSAAAENLNVPTLVKFYSLQSYSYVHTLPFRTEILAVRCSPRVVAIALATQLYCFNAATLQCTLSVPTYPSPQLTSNRLNFGHGALAVGSRWLAYAANQPINSNTGRVSPKRLTCSGVSLATSLSTGSLVVHYAKESTKQLAAGIVTLGDKGCKAISGYCTESVGSQALGIPTVNDSCSLTEHAGMVTVRDFVTKLVVSCFRAHDSPLSMLSFDHTGTLLVTASIHGHSINIFRILPVPNGNGINTSSYDVKSSHIHLYKLYRGMTNAVIQDIAFSEDCNWIVVSSSRGTHHLFAISPFGGPVGLSTHGAIHTDRALGSMQSLSWCCNRGPLVSSQSVLGALPATVSLSAVNRIKIGNGDWTGAAVSSRSGSSFGAVAVVFHDGRAHKLDAEGGLNTLKEQLWVFSPSGRLIRHTLCLSAGTGSHSNTISSPMVAGLQQQDLDLKVVVISSQEWDLCRRANWIEREEKVNVSNGHTVTHDGGGNSALSTPVMGGSSQNEAMLGKQNTSLKETTTNTQMHQWYLSNAEVHMHHLRPPIWASSQVSFRVLSKPASNKVLWENNAGGEYEIERIASHAIEVRKKDLVPAFRNHELKEDISLSRDASYLPKGQLTPVNPQSGIKFGFSTNVRGSQGHHSSCGSSCGSEASLCGRVDAGFTNCHHSHEDRSLYLQFQPVDTLAVQEPHHEESSKLQNAPSPSFQSSEPNKGVSADFICFPSSTSPCPSHEDTCIVNLTASEKSRIDFLDVPHKGKRVSVPSHGKDAVVAGGTSTRAKQPIKVGCFPNGCYCKHKGLVCSNSTGIRSDNSGVSSESEEAHRTLRSQVGQLDKTLESLQTCMTKKLEKFDQQGVDIATDVESSNELNQSKGAKGEQGDEGDHTEDGWELALFPFVEDE